MMKKLLYIALAVLLLASPLWAGGAKEAEVTEKPMAAAGFDWQSQSGSTIKIMANKHPWADIIEPKIGEFEAMTGIKVDLAIYPEDQFRTKRTVEMVSGASDVDVFMLMPGNSLAQYHQAGWVAPLDDMMKSESLLWLASPKMVISALIITDTWQWTPLILLIVLANLESLPTDPFESAKVDGANIFQVIWHITLPLVKPAIVVAAMIRSIDAIKTFDMIYVMTQGGPDVASENLNLYIFQTGFSYFRMGKASSLAIVLFTIVLVFNIFLAILRNAGDKLK